MVHPNYQTFKAVDDLSFSIEKGEIIGYLGENGAGYMITGFLLILFASLIGGIIIGAILAILCISSFWTINSNEICWSAFTLYRFAEYPISIYNNAIRFVLIFLVPFAFVSYFPAEFLLKKEFGMVSFLGPIVALILWIIAIKAWNFGLKHYKSSGS